MKEEEGAIRLYAAVVVFESSCSAVDYAPLYEEEVILVSAESEDVARDRALAYGKAAEHCYKNGYDELITISFKRLLEVKPLVDELKDFDEGVSVYSRHFHDYAAYQSFEPLLKGQPL